MASSDLHSLWKLHLIDSALVDIRARAAALDPGRSQMAKVEAAQKAYEEKSAEAKALSGELTDLELKQKGIDDKIKKFEKDLYGGKVVNPREVEAINKEIALLKKQRGESDVRILELWELVPPAKEAAEKELKVVEGLKNELMDHQKTVLASKAKMEQEFKEASARRAAAAAEVPAGILAKYDAIRNRHGGIGMSRITKSGSCGACGTNLPTKVVEDAKDDRVVTCESCHRILYYSESIL
jgi:predicted  nucleic acid-binding Zn-ribbon protein